MEERYNAYSFLLDRTARKVKQFAQRRFKEMGFNITVDQWLVLKQLYERERLKQNELAGLVFKDNPTLTRIIDLLCEKGLAERNAYPDDRRCFMVSLTSKGRTKVKEMLPRIQEVRLKAWEGLSDRDFNHFRRILNTIYENLGGDDMQP
ncbi:MAG TPA: MarR family transcriptional regulator [Cyclobacteriaceae bacterium]